MYPGRHTGETPGTDGVGGVFIGSVDQNGDTSESRGLLSVPYIPMGRLVFGGVADPCHCFETSDGTSPSVWQGEASWTRVFTSTTILPRP